MKTNNLFLLATIALLSVNCTREEIDTHFKTGTAVAVMESEDTKSAVTDEGYFTWAAGDQISIHVSGGDCLVGTLNGDGNSAEGSFSYSYTEGQTPTGYAMYPYSVDHSIDADETVTFHMPAVYELEDNISNTNAPMLAVPSTVKEVSESGEVNYHFSHLGGVIRVVFKNAPKGADKFTLSLGGSKINGKFTVKDGVISTAEEVGDGETLTTLEFTALESEQNITLFVPVPTGEYKGIEAKLYAGEGLLGEWGGKEAVNKIERRTLLLMAPITFSNAGGSIENEQKVATPTQLQDAVENGGKITLTEGFKLEADLTIPTGKEVVLDLNGQNVSTEGTILVSEGANLSIVNNAPAVAVKSGDAADVTGVTIKSDTDIIKASKGATITIGKGVNLTTTGENSCCIWVPGSDVNNIANDVKIHTAGNLTATRAGSAAIYVNGNVTSGAINITGGTVKHEADVAVYVAGKADVSVSDGCEIVGTTAMEVRAGTLTVTGGKFTATASLSDYKPNGNGTTSTGVALAICKHSTTGNKLKVEIRGGEFTGAKSILVNEDLGSVEVGISNGTFSDTEALPYITNGGTFKLSQNVEITDAITVSEGRNITFDLNGHTIENKTAGHPSNITPMVDDECVVFMVNGTLTIDDSSEGKGGCVKATGDNARTDYNVAVWAMGENANVTINNGNYTNSKDTKGDGCDLIYARDGAQIEINGGSFKSYKRYTLGSEVGGVYDVLNCMDGDGSEIVVNGGRFQNYAPSYEPVGIGSSTAEVVLGEGKAVYKGGAEGKVVVETAHGGSDETWYFVE